MPVTKPSFASGEDVFVKFTDSDKWFPAKVSDPSLKTKIEVEFDDGTVGEFPPTRIMSQTRMRKSRSRSRGRSRSRSRGRSPGRKAKQSPSPSRQQKQTPKSGKSKTPRVGKTPTTPTRQSARLIEKAVEEEKAADEKPVKQSSSRRSAKGGKAAEPSKYEFGGPVGVFVMMLFLPATILVINQLCGKECVLKMPQFPRTLSAYFDRDAAVLYLSWITIQVLLAMLPVGRVVDGVTLKSGNKLKYRCNGFFAFVVSVATFIILTVYLKYPVSMVYKKLFPMAVTGILFSCLLSVALYIRARKVDDSALSETGSSGNPIYDFFMGRELNPRIGPIDLKFFCELRPGLIGWVMLNLVFLTQDMATSGNAFPNKALLLVSLFQAWYVGEALWFEDAILTTMDITHDGFGYMLALGDLAWVPFLYSLQGKFLLEFRPEWSNLALAGFFLLNLVGYIIFRGSNSQKNKFRTNPYDPSLAHLETLPTPAGKRLLVSGWWGLCRHPNYLGDLIMALAWSLPCGFTHVLPYWYPIYFLFLLIDRARRDDAVCRKKYGAAWDRYCQRVKYRIFPYIY